MKTKINICKEYMTTVIAFIYFAILSFYKLMQAPFWGDECMEYICSLTTKGPINGITDYASMYERMANIQQQPPLYNWFLCLWIKISENDAWIRTSSIMFGFIAMIGLYTLVMKLGKKRNLAAFSVIIVSSIFVFQYYMKEAAEYSMMLAILFWILCFFYDLLKNPSTKGAIIFTILCVLAMYTHYGTAFFIIPAALIVLVNAYANSNKKLGNTLLISDVVAVLGGGIPLVALFLYPQSFNSVSTLQHVGQVEWENDSVIYDIFSAIEQVNSYFLIDIDRDRAKLQWFILAAVLAFIAIAIVVAAKTKDVFLKNLLIFDASTYILFYVATKLNIYAYGWFMTRYDLFMFPLMIVTVVSVIIKLLEILPTKTAKIASYVLFALFCLYCLYGIHRVDNHWTKRDERTVVSMWYDMDLENSNTFVNEMERYGFYYYFTHNSEYNEEYWNNIYMANQKDISNNSSAEWSEYLQTKAYPDGIPTELYVVTNYDDELIKAFRELGYSTEELVDTTVGFFRVWKE